MLPATKPTLQHAASEKLGRTRRKPKQKGSQHGLDEPQPSLKVKNARSGQRDVFAQGEPFVECACSRLVIKRARQCWLERGVAKVLVSFRHEN